MTGATEDLKKEKDLKYEKVVVLNSLILDKESARMIYSFW